MNNFTSTDIENYYDQTEVHYRMFWQFEQASGLHYMAFGMKQLKILVKQYLTLIKLLMNLGEFKKEDLERRFIIFLRKLVTFREFITQPALDKRKLMIMEIGYFTCLFARTGNNSDSEALTRLYESYKLSTH